MSGKNEHTSEKAEAKIHAENHNKEQLKNETSMLNNETEQLMLEDEEMPTYISVSSPSKREDSDINNTKEPDRIPIEEDHSRSPYPTDDQGGGSIYVLSSGEDSNHPYNDEEEDEYVDSEDMEEMDLENEHDNTMLDDEEDEDEDDDDDENPLRLHNDDDEDIETEYEPECFDRVSDDFVLNNRLKQHHKERSLSLQDLSTLKNNIHSSYNKKRHSLNIFRHNYLGIQQNPIFYPVAQKRQMMKYQHVESKVKQYIKDIKEQNRKSMEKRMKEQEFIMNKNHNEKTENNDPEQLKTKVTNRTIKDYAEKAIQDLQRDETENDNLMYNTEQILENGENNKSFNRVIGNQYKYIRKDSEYNDISNELKSQGSVKNQSQRDAEFFNLQRAYKKMLAENIKRVRNSDKLEKRNGSVDVNTHHIEYQIENALERNIRFGINQSSSVNGHQATPTFINLRTLSYEEYMRGASNTEQKEELPDQRQEKTNESEIYNEAEMINAQEIDNSNTSYPLKIESVESIGAMQDEPGNFGKLNVTEKMNVENIEITELKSQLNQKDAEFLNLQDAYQKVLAENMKMKQELDALKQSLVKYKDQNKTCETKIASVQTEAVVEPVSNQNTVSSGEINNKISTSSVASTISSIDQWADSAGSPAISIKLPDLTPILNSDDSIVLTDRATPRKIAHPFSRTFITSSRILQTLSNIQGKTKTESPLARNTKKRLNENSTDQPSTVECNSPIHASSSKKRKATEMLGTSTFTQPFKIPHTTVESERKDTSDVEFKYPEEHTVSNTEQKEKGSVNKDSLIDQSINDFTPVETKVKQRDDHEDSVKCFIYREDENSKNRSFLIQAEEPTKDGLDTEKNRIQECGPYLLGNLEVRMSEINGTISVWGKEIDHESTSDNEDDLEACEKLSEQKMCHYWQNASQTRFNGSPLVCSTNKKQKVPSNKFNRSDISQCCHSLSLNSSKISYSEDDINDKRDMNNSFSPSICVPSCENCNSSKHHKEWTCRNASSSQEKLHSCCMHHIEVIDKECSCSSCHEKQKHDVSFKHCKDKFHSKEVRRNSCKNTFPLDLKNSLHENNPSTTAELSNVTNKYACRCSIQNVSDNRPHSRCCSPIRDISCTCKSSLDNTNNHSDAILSNHHEHSDKHTCNRFSNNGEEEPLIPIKRSSETLETRQRRLSGKRVRGILMDLLKGCGDCRNNSSAGLSKTEYQKETPYMINGPPRIKVSSLTPEPTCSTSTQCNKCCHAYARRIESQLEEFRMEMERVRSRSDAILNMLNMLHSVDAN
ncbi:MATH and LRR domain-containing protein PFE0570w-like isoform X2 [Frieseomelitta varia]|nr:MATH and LRR domain-containing protein PFE0570w-like isoform X2 [Frieseomelitta varia]